MSSLSRLKIEQLFAPSDEDVALGHCIRNLQLTELRVLGLRCEAMDAICYVDTLQKLQVALLAQKCSYWLACSDFRSYKLAEPRCTRSKRFPMTFRV
jgi:hypothetical protein